MHLITTTDREIILKSAIEVEQDRAEGQHRGLFGATWTWLLEAQLWHLMIKSHLIKVTNPKRSSMGKEKLLGISMQLKDSKTSVLRLNAWHEAALVQPQSRHVLQSGSITGHS